MKTIHLLFIGLLLLTGSCNNQKKSEKTKVLPDQLFEFSDNVEPRWFSFENITGSKGQGGKENNGAKGHPADIIKSGESKILLDTQGPGIINRMWITINNRSPQMLRALKIEMFWDNENKPAVSAPFGDFFGVGLGKTVAFESALFANPEGRSFNCFIPMPFKKAAKIVITNQSDEDLQAIFFDINLQLLKTWGDNFLYFHCYWHRDTATTLAKDFEILPLVNGKGRFLGSNIGINCNENYKGFWWGEGEVKVYFDGDKEYPTLVGTGTEDYISSAWGQGKFNLKYSGCLVADYDKDEWAFYRYHIPDPVYFKNDCRITIQQIGGGSKAEVISLINKGVKLIPVSVNDLMVYNKDSVIKLDDPALPDGWTNFFRSDDVSSAAYFYLDQPKNDLPDLQSVGLRLYKLK
jgi:hypothetical protein